jgi:RNA polymerase sigma-70 factor (ECF subfamily)
MATADELARLYDAHAAALYAFVLNLTRQEADARDLLQDLFVKLARRPDLLRELREERAFLLRLAHNLVVDLARRRAARERRQDAFSSEQLQFFAPTEDPDEELFRTNLSAALAELPAEQRAVVHLKLWEGLTFEAIAEALGISPNTAASRYRYGVDKLRQRLRPFYDEMSKS